MYPVVLPPLPEAVVPPLALAPPSAWAPPVPSIPPDEELPPIPVVLDPATPPCPVPPPVELAPPFVFDGECEVLPPHAPIMTTHAHTPRCIFGFRVWLREVMSGLLGSSSAASRFINRNHGTEIMTRTSWPKA